MDRRSKWIATACILALAGAAFSMFRFFGEDHAVSEETFFYDLSDKSLFAAKRDEIPPILGTDHTTEDAVRAVVISTNGHPKDKTSWKIAYLEMYSPELKSQMLKARTGGGSPSMGRGAAQEHRFVKRPEDKEWSSMMSAEGQHIVSDWAVPGPDGLSPVVCSP